MQLKRMKAVTLLRRAQFHGAKRIAESRHRIYWTIALLLLLWLALSVLAEMIIRFLDMPTHLIKLDTTSERIPFPSVEVCPEIRFPQEKIEKLLEIAKYPNRMNATYLRPLIPQLAAFFSPDVPYTLLELYQVQQFFEYNNLDMETAGVLLTTSCEEIFIRCRFQWTDVDCAQLFHMELTLYGFCCVFNSRSLKRELNLNIRQNNHNNEWFTTEVGPFSALMMAINQSQISDNVDLSYKWLVVQSSQRYVDTSMNGTPISPGTEEWSGFWTKNLQVAEDSRFMGDRIRGCQIDNKPLQYFPVYTRKRCLVECRMLMTMQRCQCLLPVHYRPNGVPICHALSLPCARRVQVEVDRGICDCPFTCEYQSELTDSTTYRFSTYFKSYDSFYDGLDLKRVTVVRVYVKSHETTSYVRRSYFNFYDLFAQLGGIFNVFFGCSVLTLLELLQLVWYSCRKATRIEATTGDVLLKPASLKKSTASGLCRGKKKGRVEKRKVLRKKVMFSKFRGLNEVNLY